ncbi:MAG: RC-LH1 core complex protein PufX [Pseudomonadota bacterium]
MMMKKPDGDVQTKFTAGEIFSYMAQGAFYAALVLTAAAGFVIFFWVIGRLLPPEEAYFSMLDTATTLLA